MNNSAFDVAVLSLVPCSCANYLRGTGSYWPEKGDGGSEARFQMLVERSDGTAAEVAAAFAVSGAAADGPLQSAVAGEAWWGCSQTQDRTTVVVALAQTAS